MKDGTHYINRKILEGSKGGREREREGGREDRKKGRRKSGRTREEGKKERRTRA